MKGKLKKIKFKIFLEDSFLLSTFFSTEIVSKIKNNVEKEDHLNLEIIYLSAIY